MTADRTNLYIAVTMKNATKKSLLSGFFLGFGLGVKGDRNGDGVYVQMKTKAYADAFKRGYDAGHAFGKDAMGGIAPGLTASDYIEASLAELGLL